MPGLGYFMSTACEPAGFGLGLGAKPQSTVKVYSELAVLLIRGLIGVRDAEVTLSAPLSLLSPGLLVDSVG